MVLPQSGKASFDIDLFKEALKDLLDIYGNIIKIDVDKSLVVLKSDNFDVDKEGILQRLSDGEKLFILSSYKTIGAGQNLQYEIKDRSQFVLNKLIKLGFKTYSGSSEKDIPASKKLGDFSDVVIDFINDEIVFSECKRCHGRRISVVSEDEARLQKLFMYHGLKEHFDKDNIERDFDIYMISKEVKGDYFKSNVLDIPNIEFKAKSVVYTWGNEWFVMFAKNSIDYREFKEAIVNECPEVIINKIDVRVDKTIYSNVLAQLLFNSLASPERKKLQYNNLTGKVIKSQYIFDKKSGRFRKKLKRDNYQLEESYLAKNIYKKHNTVDFLDFSSYKKFCDCKIGIFVEFINDVETYLADYIVISIGGYDKYENYEIKDNGVENKQYREILEKKPINIVDEESEVLCGRLIDHFARYYNLKATIGRMNSNFYNIRVIRNKDFYEKNELEDQYAVIDSGSIVQHVTIEDFKFSDDKEWNAIDDAYRDYDVSSKEREVEGLVYKNINNINVIMKTEQTTMPNLKALKEVLELSDKNKTIPTNKVIDYVKEFMSDRVEYKEEGK